MITCHVICQAVLFMLSSQYDIYVLLSEFCIMYLIEQEDGADITANSLHPGVIVINLFQHMGVVDGKFVYDFTTIIS